MSNSSALRPSENSNDTPEKPKKPTPDKGLTKLKPMSGIGGILERIKRRAGRLMMGAAISAGVATGAGEYAQHEYRSKLNYDPDRIAADDKSSEKPKAEKPKSLIDGSLDKLRRFGNEQIDQMTDNVETIKQYKDMVKQYNEFKANALKFGDNASFWLTFALTFLVMAKLLAAIHRQLRPMDPVLEDNIKTLAAAVNRLESKLNSLDKTDTQSLKQLTSRFSELEPAIRGAEKALLHR